ncbi:MAG TPA: D-alanyl-D-alanine carboxypeptidase family protein [Acidimicrobiia bacterium]|nr:D-alanyl-D-alanine carboxypeptidase family protein [Acidimicrobiia bacterium]
MKRSLRLSGAIALVLSALAMPVAAAPFTYPAPVQQTFPTPAPPTITAAAWILYDESTDTVIAELNADQERAMASVTKIMTGLLAIERSEPEDLVTVSQRAAETGEKEIDLVPGETVAMDALFKALLIHSANDAATAIAEHISGSVEDFVDLMNQRSAELGLTHTSFANPHGLDAPNHHTSARDLLELGRIAMGMPEFAEVVKAKKLVFPPAPDGTPRTGSSTNLMLWSYPGTLGLKTGFTAQALLTYVASAEREGRRLYAVLLGSDGERAHFSDATALFDYGFEELGFFGDASTGAAYAAVQGRRATDPLASLASMETYLHLASQGLMLESPGPLREMPEPAPPPIVEVTRSPHPGPRTVTETMRFWLDLALGA